MTTRVRRARLALSASCTLAIATSALAPPALAYHKSLDSYGCKEKATAELFGDLAPSDQRWTAIPSPRQREYDDILEYAVNPRDPKTLYAADFGFSEDPSTALFHSADGGCSWRGMAPLPLAGVKPDLVQIVVPGGGRLRGHVWLVLHDRATSITSIVKSENNGKDWAEPQIVSHVGTPSEVKTAPGNPKRMYLAIDVPLAQDVASDVPGPADRTIFYVTGDGGVTWESTLAPGALLADAAADTPVTAYVDFDLDPKDADVLWAAGTTGGVFVSRDGARTWKRVDDAIKTSEERRRTPTAVAVAPGGRVAVFFSGAVDHRVTLSENGGRSWNEYRVPGAAVSAVFRRPTIPEEVRRMARENGPAVIRQYRLENPQTSIELVFSSAAGGIGLGLFIGYPEKGWVNAKEPNDVPTILDRALTDLVVAEDRVRTVFGIPVPTYGAVDPFEVIGFSPFGDAAGNVHDLTF